MISISFRQGECSLGTALAAARSLLNCAPNGTNAYVAAHDVEHSVIVWLTIKDGVITENYSGKETDSKRLEEEGVDNAS